MHIHVFTWIYNSACLVGVAWSNVCESPRRLKLNLLFLFTAKELHQLRNNAIAVRKRDRDKHKYSLVLKQDREMNKHQQILYTHEMIASRGGFRSLESSFLHDWTPASWFWGLGLLMFARMEGMDRSRGIYAVTRRRGREKNRKVEQHDDKQVYKCIPMTTVQT